MASLSRKFQDHTVDTLEKCSSARSRAGSVVERIGKMDAAGVSPNVIAAQLTERSPTGKIYTAREVEVLRDVYIDSRSRTLITAKQTTALIEDARNNEPRGSLVPNMA